MAYLDNIVSGKYKAGYTVGFHEREYREWIQLGGQESHWQAANLAGDREYEMGLKDGRGDRKAHGYPPNKDGDFFAYNISGFPWGTHLEIDLYDKGFDLVYVDASGNEIDHTVDPHPSPEYYRLKKQQ